MTKIPPAKTQRLDALIKAALETFCTYGYERTQMSDVAKAMGAATGTVYLYVESKEALFDLVLRAQASPITREALELPIKTPAPGATLKFLKAQFDRPGQWPALERALKSERAENVEAELRAILRELYESLSRHRAGLTLLRRSVLEFPGLYELYVQGLRKRLNSDLARYLEMRIAAGQLVSQRNEGATAALMMQTIAWATVLRPWDPEHKKIDDGLMEETVLDMLVRGMLPR